MRRVNMTVAFLGSDDYWRTTELVLRKWNIFHKLVAEGADIFIFTNANNFDRTCYEMIAQLKMHHSNIELHYYHAGFDYDVGYMAYMSEIYDKVFFPPMGSLLPRQVRDRQIIDKCDILITYCSANPLHEGQQRTALSIEYAKQKNKRVINII